MSQFTPSSEYVKATPRCGCPATTLVYTGVSPIAINRRTGLNTLAPHPVQFRPFDEYATVFVPLPVATHFRDPHVIPRPHFENTVLPSPNQETPSAEYASVFTVPHPVATKLRPFHSIPYAYTSNPFVALADPELYPFDPPDIFVHVFPSCEIAIV